VLNALRHQRFGHVRGGPSDSSACLCSTPYGIRGLGTGHPRIIRTTLTVLNALRHQRFGHSSICCQISKKLSAQRLTASEVWAPSGCSSVTGTPFVLNALRHQRFGHLLASCVLVTIPWCSTPYGIRGLGTSLSQCGVREFEGCSTPYGIRGLGTVAIP